METANQAERLVQQTSSDDDSDVDLVTDYLITQTTPPSTVTTGINQSTKLITKTINTTKDVLLNNNNNNLNNIKNNKLNSIQIGIPTQATGTTTFYHHNNNSSTPNSNNNMVPIISVTPHSPGAKYSGILEDTLNHLQCIRESIVQMKNTNSQNTNYGAAGLINSSLSASRIFSSCPSLPDLTQAGVPNMWQNQTQIYGGLNSDRRKSWTAIEDLTECAKGHKSVSLSSLDSEEQESSLRAVERLHNRTSRNSTGGISTHSLNDAELARDFEKIVAKRNLAPIMTRIPLQKSISTPSIAPIRNQSTKEESNITTEAYADHPEKRRKRNSLFFRKKKDKTKTKGQTTTCDVCNGVVNIATFKEHVVECKAKAAKNQQKSSSSKKNSTNSHSTSSHHHDDHHTRDYYDVHGPNDHINYSDETPLIRDEFLSEPPIGPHDLGAEPILRVAIEEHDSWSPSVPKEVVKSLKDKQVKRQEHIYEFIMTEKHHCQTLLVMQKVFVESLHRHFSTLNLDRMFPRLPELTELHINFLRKLRLKQNENHIVDSIADILLEFFSSISAQRLKSAYGEFCSNHRSALGTFKCYMTGDQTFAEWYKHCQINPLLKKKGIPECILFITQRLTKYPLLIDPLLKSSREDKVEQEKLQKAMSLVKEILVDVDARVADKEKEDRQLEIFKRIDAKSYAIFKKNKYKKSDIIAAPRKLKFEGLATLMQGRSKMQSVLVVVLSDCLFFLQENSNKYTFFSPENKEGVVSLQKLLIREKAGTESRGIYIISSNPAFPEMYELKVQNPKDKNIWIQSIRAAVVDCPADGSEIDDMTIEQKQKLLDARQSNIRNIIYKLRQKDLEQAILLEEKLALQYSLFVEHLNTTEPGLIGPGAEEFLSNFGSYRNLVTDDCDTVELWKRVIISVQEISHLASTLYSAATGLPLSRSLSSVGERQSEAYISPTLPKRAETFGGFDERRSKGNLPWKDAVLSNFPGNILAQRQIDEKRNSNTSEHDTSIITKLTEQQLKQQQQLHQQQNPQQQNNNDNNLTIKDHNYAALQVTHNLQLLLTIIQQQMTTIQSLQSQLLSFRDNQKSIYRHDDQLEELRNLQDRLQEEKTLWLKTKETQEKDLADRARDQQKLQEQIRAEQEDIKQQRDQLYRKMEILSSQGLLHSPSVALPINITNQTDDIHSQYNIDELNYGDSNLSSDRRKDKWKTSTMTKAPPVNLLSATNAPKSKESNIKQQIPMKLSSLSSTKQGNALTSPNSTSGSVTQLFPLKLADKRNPNMTATPNHSRTGSSPAIIQQQTTTHTGHPATRTNTYPKIPERYRLPSAPDTSSPLQSYQHQQRSLSVHGQLPTTPTSSTQQQQQQQNRNEHKDKSNQEEEVIYF